jgi:RNA polymerase sporulation-specific sigma factor
LIVQAKPPLSQAQICILIRRAQGGDRLAREELVEHNLRLVIRIANNFCYRSGRDFDDAMSDGLWGLARAIRNYDPDRGFTFSTFAWSHIENSMKWAARPVEASLDQIVRGTEGLSLLETMADESIGPEALAVQDDLVGQVQDSLDILTEREREVVIGLYGLDRSEASVSELAHELDLSVSRVARIHKSALSRLYRDGRFDAVA